MTSRGDSNVDSDQQCHESGYEPFMGCLFHGRGQAGDPCTCGPVGPVDKSEDRYGVDRNEHEPSFACSESEFARDDEFKALQKAHQRLKGRYKKLERTVTLKDQIIKTREFEISELRKGLR